MKVICEDRSLHGNKAIDLIVADFRAHWDQTNRPLREFWTHLDSKQNDSVLSALIKADFELRFQSGERPAAADYFAEFPQIVQNRDRVISLVYEEFCLLEENHESPTVEDFCERYEPWSDSLVSQLGYHRDLSQIVGLNRSSTIFPKAGERFENFCLNSLLGTGGAAQVYLATDDLGERKVVLKISPSLGMEPSILARLDHRGIVPILTLATSAESGLHGICMPYRPGLTLDSLLKKMNDSGRPRKARMLYDLLDIPSSQRDTKNSGWNDFPLNGTYTEAVAWIGIALADALAYLHEEGVFHRDIKPGNIWLAYRDGPLLFDFNLAHCPSDSEHAHAALSGGTLPYMAPEQLRAFLDPQHWDAVGIAADIYSLGLVLRELVTGTKPESQRTDLPIGRAIQDLHDRRQDLITSIRILRPDLPASLDAIILKCLAVSPHDRYQNAADLSTDLKHFLNREFLSFAANSSCVEVAINWSVRRWKWLVSVALIVLLTCFGLFVTRESSVDPSLVRDGVQLLKSSKEEHWRKAREIFSQLTREHPQNAEPLLYLGYACYRLNQPGDGKMYLQEAYLKKDFESAIKTGLTYDQDSVQLKMSMGEYYLYIKQDIPKARSLGQDLCLTHPKHFGVWKFLGIVEHVAQNFLLSLNNYQTAIQVASSQGNANEAKSIRNELAFQLLIDLDHLLINIPNLANRREAQSILEQIEPLIAILSMDKEAGLDPFFKAQVVCMQGTCSSAAGYLHSLDFEREKGEAEFKNALASFQRVLQLVDQNRFSPRQAQKLRNLAKNQLAELKRRVKICATNLTKIRVEVK